jgi:hypothetical protein
LKSHLIAALLASPALLVAMVGALAELDRPFASIIGLQPRAMDSVLTSVVQSSNQSPAVFRPCSDLAGGWPPRPGKVGSWSTASSDARAFTSARSASAR